MTTVAVVVVVVVVVAVLLLLLLCCIVAVVVAVVGGGGVVVGVAGMPCVRWCVGVAVAAGTTMTYEVFYFNKHLSQTSNKFEQLSCKLSLFKFHGLTNHYTGSVTCQAKARASTGYEFLHSLSNEWPPLP